MELVPIDQVILDPNNARDHPRKNIDEIKASLRDFGQQKNIVIKKDMTVVAGNGTVIAARELGWKEIKANITELTDEEAMAYALADNQVALSATWNPEILNQQLEILKVDFDLPSFGFELPQLNEPDDEHSGNSVRDRIEAEARLRELNIILKNGDCLEVLKTIPNDSIDALITDPPAGIAFMNKEWDEDKGGRDEWIKWMSEVMTQVNRVLKPGAHGLVWAIPRTSHWTATAVENAGFEIRDVVTHLFGTGFPKSLNIAKAIDKELGEERKIVGFDKNHHNIKGSGKNARYMNPQKNERIDIPITVAASEEAQKWDGFGSSLKPASEHWILVRKPISEKSIAQNVLKHGTGGINIDECRISVDENESNKRNNPSTSINAMFGNSEMTRGATLIQGRFPANLILSHNPDCEYIGTKEVGNGDAQKGSTLRSNIGFKLSESSSDRSNSIVNYGKETVANYKCTPGCAVAMLDEQSGKVSYNPLDLNGKSRGGKIYGNNKVLPSGAELYAYGDKGGASRFFYCAKPSGSEKDAGTEDSNSHPTVKSDELMQYLIKLITPPMGTVLDCFMGSGTTGISCVNLNMNFYGIEKELEYYNIALDRITYANDKRNEERKNGSS